MLDAKEARKRTESSLITMDDTLKEKIERRILEAIDNGNSFCTFGVLPNTICVWLTNLGYEVSDQNGCTHVEW